MIPKISIIVPVYNVEQFLHRCIDSILNQTLKDFELILVDDGSPDNCGKICDEYSLMDERIRVIHKENGGVSSARNAGFKIAKGEYIGFVDSDDFIDKRMYEILYKYGEKYNADIVMCDHLNVTNEEIELQCKDFIVEEIYSNIEALHQLFSKDNDSNFIIVCNKIFKRHLFNDLSFEIGKRHEDEFIAHRILYKSSKVVFLPIKLYFYYQRNGSFMNSPFNITRMDEMYAFKDRIKFFKEKKLSNLQWKAELRYVNKFLLGYFSIKGEAPNSKELKKFKKTFCKSLISMIRNPYFIPKEKISWLIFVVNPDIYKFTFSLTGKIKNRL